MSVKQPFTFFSLSVDYRIHPNLCRSGGCLWSSDACLCRSDGQIHQISCRIAAQTTVVEAYSTVIAPELSAIAMDFLTNSTRWIYGLPRRKQRG
jgi:hypothetical protein